MKRLLQSGRLRYLLAGAWNTVFGYGIGVGFLYAFHDRLNTAVIGLICNVLGITMSFLTYKLFVFRTRGRWLVEYLRCYVVYGGVALVGIGLLWLFVDGMHLAYWLAQALVVLLTVLVSYIGHAKFTFRTESR